MGNGWIKLHRKLLENPIFKNEKYLKLWLYLLLSANHKPDKIMWNGGILDIQKGQFVTGRDALVTETGLAATTVERILNYLENGHMIGQQKTTKFRVITILKWDDYQYMDIETDNKRTTNGQQTDTNKNDNNVKNDKKDTAQSAERPLPKEFQLFWERYPRKVGKSAALVAWNKCKNRPSLEKILATLDAQISSAQWKRDGGQFIPHPATWLNQGRWDDEQVEIISSKVHKF